MALNKPWGLIYDSTNKSKKLNPCTCSPFCGEMADFGEDDKNKGKVDKSNTYNGFNNYILFFIHWRTSSD